MREKQMPQPIYVYRLPDNEARNIAMCYSVPVPHGLKVKVYSTGATFSMEWRNINWSRWREAA